MNKEEVVNAIAHKTGLTKTDVRLTLDSFLQIINDTLASGGKVKISGLGVFEVKERASRVGRNPQTNIPVQIPAKKVPTFKPSESLKSVIESSRGEIETQ